MLAYAAFGGAKYAGSGADANLASRSLILNLVSDSLDHSTNAATVTTTGSPTRDANGLNLDGSTQCLSLADASRWTFGTNGGIELKGIKFTAVNRVQYLVCQRDAGHPLWGLQMGSDGKLTFFQSNSGGTFLTQLTTTSALSAATLYDIGVKRASSSCSIWVNGSSVGVSGTNSATAYTDVANPLTLFSQGAGDTTVRFAGSIKGVRLTNGVAPDMSSMPYPFPVL
jgi:hypothetical protein